MKVLITGGAGYIGSITNALLRLDGHDTIIFDNLVNGYKQAVGETPLVIGDLTKKQDISKLFEKESFDTVIHFAALALAGESMEKPYEYYYNNIVGGMNLLEAMRSSSCRSIIFSSTCAVYGYPQKLPVTEETAIAPVSVYGSSKRMFEEILMWYEQLYGIRHVILRYFNASGAMLDGSLGEDHKPETHIIPIAMQVAGGKRKAFEVFGGDYDTPDGTCIRDYIHVLDLSSAHIKAAEYLQQHQTSLKLNLGSGKGYSNLEVLDTIQRVTGKKITRKIKERRPGDPAAIYADSSKAKKILKWEPKYDNLENIVESAWKWHSSHPNGYGS